MAKKQSKLIDSIEFVAVMKREEEPEETGYESHVKEIYIDSDNFLVGEASCGQTCFICFPSELPALIAYLEKVRDGIAKENKANGKKTTPSRP